MYLTHNIGSASALPIILTGTWLESRQRSTCNPVKARVRQMALGLQKLCVPIGIYWSICAKIGEVDGLWQDQKKCFRSARRFGAVGSSPDFSRGFSRHLASRHLSRNTLLKIAIDWPGFEQIGQFIVQQDIRVLVCTGAMGGGAFSPSYNDGHHCHIHAAERNISGQQSQVCKDRRRVVTEEVEKDACVQQAKVNNVPSVWGYQERCVSVAEKSALWSTTSR